MEWEKVHLLIYDCDGVLTDNRVLVSETGEEYAIFHRGDGFGIRMLKDLGIRQVIISTEANPIVMHRARKLDIDVLYHISDKRSAVLAYCRENGFMPNEAMFIGNDLNDCEAMEAVGFRGCPNDAEPEIRMISDWVSERNGGCGVIRDLYRQVSDRVREV